MTVYPLFKYVNVQGRSYTWKRNAYNEIYSGNSLTRSESSVLDNIQNISNHGCIALL